MAQPLHLFGLLIFVSLLSSCGLVDSGVAWREGPYALVWIDTAENVSLYREGRDGSTIGRVEPTVFAVGWDGRYLVAKQHPHGDRHLTHYFIVDARNDTDFADPAQSVSGPLSLSEYQSKSSELHLPAFSTVLNSLQ